MNFKILGSGCTNCQRLEATTRAAVDQLGLDATFEDVTDQVEIASWGVMRTPALVIDDAVVLAGRVPSTDDVKKLLTR